MFPFGREFLGFSAFLAAFAVVPAHAGEPEPIEDGWILTRDTEDKTCSVGLMLEHKVTHASSYFFVHYSPSEKEVVVSFTSPETSSLPEKGEVELKLVFLDNDGEKYDDGWGMRKFSYFKSSSGHTFMGRFVNLTNVQQILDDITKSSTIAFFTERRVVVDSINLKGSANAIRRVRDCAYEASGLNPNDPFLK